MKNFFVKFLATGLGFGFIPYAPGTCGSLLGVFLFYIFRNEPKNYLIMVAVAVTVLAVVVAQQAEGVFGKKDAQQIVIDEVAGQFIAYLFIPYSLFYLIAGFVLFRFFDITKIFPARWVQNNVRGGFGVVGDDVVAGIQAGLILYLVSLVM